MGCFGSTSARQETATECVECRCTIAPAAGRSAYMDRCRTDSLVCFSPDCRWPFASTFDRVAGSSRPRQELVGVISQPSSRRTLILPELPTVSPRSNIDLPKTQISSLIFNSFMLLFCLKIHSNRRGAKARRKRRGKQKTELG